jgi:hypothetical protein
VNEYRVTIDTMDEQYLYEVDAYDEEHARAEAEYLALIDGLNMPRWYDSQVDLLTEG